MTRSWMVGRLWQHNVLSEESKFLIRRTQLYVVVWNIFHFTPTWGRFPIWLIFFRCVGSTTNQNFESVGSGELWGLTNGSSCRSRPLLSGVFFFNASNKKGKPLYNSTRFFFAQEDPNGPKMFTIFYWFVLNKDWWSVNYEATVTQRCLLNLKYIQAGLSISSTCRICENIVIIHYTYIYIYIYTYMYT